MNIQDIREYCISKPSVNEGFPFNDTALVLKVMGKMFALLDLSEDSRGISLKCDPDMAIELRERFNSVGSGYHLNKQLWNTINIDGTIDDRMIYQWIDDSYHLIIDKMPKKDQQRLRST